MSDTNNVIMPKMVIKTKSVIDSSTGDEQELEIGYAPKVLCVGIGQGGGRLANSLAIAFNSKRNTVFINTSMKDIDGLGISIPSNRTIKLGMAIEGTGKDRKVAENLLRTMYMKIADQLKGFMAEDDYDFVFICFSTSGGTGSGMGPKITALLNSDEIINSVKESLKTEKIPLVFGLAATPEISFNEGNLSLENTLECLEDINKQKEKARYLIINNGLLTTKVNGERTSILETINTTTASILKRYILEYGVSRISNLDRADRYGALNCMGIHAFGLLDAEGDRTPSPFFFPDGEHVRRVCYEVPDVMEKKVLSSLRNSGLIASDIIHGLYDSDSDENRGLSPIIGFHGFMNVPKIAEMFDKRLKLNRENAQRIEKENINSASGLDDVAKERESREFEYGRKAASSISSIFD